MCINELRVSYIMYEQKRCECVVVGECVCALIILVQLRDVQSKSFEIF